MDQKQSVAVTIALQMRHDKPYVREFRKSTYELTDLLRETLAAAPVECPECAASVIERAT